MAGGLGDHPSGGVAGGLGALTPPAPALCVGKGFFRVGGGFQGVGSSPWLAGWVSGYRAQLHDFPSLCAMARGWLHVCRQKLQSQQPRVHLGCCRRRVSRRARKGCAGGSRLASPARGVGTAPKAGVDPRRQLRNLADIVAGSRCLPRDVFAAARPLAPARYKVA